MVYVKVISVWVVLDSDIRCFSSITKEVGDEVVKVVEQVITPQSFYSSIIWSGSQY